MFAVGTTAELFANFVKDGAEPVDPSSLAFDIIRIEDDVIVLADAVPERISLGYYKASWDIPNDASLGAYRIHWKVVIEGIPANGYEAFDVGTTEMTTDQQLLNERLRARLSEEKTDEFGDGSETMFKDSAIFDMLGMTGNNLNLATLEGWIRKAAKFQRLIDISESGSTRELSQKFKSAKEMIDLWTNRCGKDAEGRLAAMRGRVVGRAVNLREPLPDPAQWQQMPKRSVDDTIVSFPDHEIIISASS